MGRKPKQELEGQKLFRPKKGLIRHLGQEQHEGRVLLQQLERERERKSREQQSCAEMVINHASSCYDEKEDAFLVKLHLASHAWTILNNEEKATRNSAALCKGVTETCQNFVTPTSQPKKFGIKFYFRFIQVQIYSLAIERSSQQYYKIKSCYCYIKHLVIGN